MIVGLCTAELHFHDAQSLKGKRTILVSLKARLQNRFNISIDENHLWQKAILGIASVANETARVNQTLDYVLNDIRANPSLEVLRSQIEVL